MGGYGALKSAFARPALFAAVAAVSPMIEPALDASAVRLRNRYHYPAEVPQALLGPDRDPALYRADHPAARAQRNAAALRESGLPIYVDAAGDDALHAHDGAEHLHRVLWDLDLAHEYRLRRDSDHVGPDLLARLQDAFRWVGERLSPAVSDPAIDYGRAALRAQLEPLRREAALRDPTFTRRCGVLP
jgi:S-formylglutathione hydrolase